MAHQDAAADPDALTRLAPESFLRRRSAETLGKAKAAISVCGGGVGFHDSDFVRATELAD
jgi:hypothetical protein